MEVVCTRSSKRERSHHGTAERASQDGGFIAGTTLNAPVDAGALQQRAREAGLPPTDGRNFFPDGNGDQFVRLPYCGLTEGEIEDGVASLAGVVRSLR
jgi:DNA-binding transcriptional MocR family regulator